VGCGQSVPKSGLLRLVADDGRLVPDPAARMPGRGAYVHRDPACWQRALGRRAFARALRTAVTPPAQAPFVHQDWRPPSADT